MKDFSTYRIALAHHWFFAMSGGERVCEAIFRILGNPDIFCIAGDRTVLPPSMRGAPFTTSFIQSIPGSRRWYRHWAALFPPAVRLLDLSSYGLVVSSDAAVIKGIRVAHGGCHICYCHSPMRYAWNMLHEYRNGLRPLMRPAFSLTMRYLRHFDLAAAYRVHHFAANSRTVARRIRQFYGREATVIYPPCEVDRFQPSESPGDYYLFVGRLVRYKRADLAVKVFTGNRRRMLVVGSGPEEKALRSMAGRNVEFTGWVCDEELAQLYARCRAVVFPGEDDFGIVPVEAQASGRPVIAFGRGGATETVLPGVTGLLFDQQTPESLDAAVRAFEAREGTFDPWTIRKHAEQFGADRFEAAFGQFLARCIKDHEDRGKVRRPARDDL